MPHALNHEGVFSARANPRSGRVSAYGLTVHPDKGGPGGNIKTAALVIEELAQGCPSTAMCYTMHMSTIPMIAALAQNGQVEDILNPSFEVNV